LKRGSKTHENRKDTSRPVRTGPVYAARMRRPAQLRDVADAFLLRSGSLRTGKVRPLCPGNACSMRTAEDMRSVCRLPAGGGSFGAGPAPDRRDGPGAKARAAGSCPAGSGGTRRAVRWSSGRGTRRAARRAGRIRRASARRTASFAGGGGAGALCPGGSGGFGCRPPGRAGAASAASAEQQCAGCLALQHGPAATGHHGQVGPACRAGLQWTSSLPDRTSTNRDITRKRATRRQEGRVPSSCPTGRAGTAPRTLRRPIDLRRRRCRCCSADRRGFPRRSADRTAGRPSWGEGS